ncbi:aldo/keto reductase [candidate division KSB1 bacterium]|nr:aldo/keto reductase [candidate division KSB1 bacterium]
MKKRPLGKTGLELTLIGVGGFHLVETPMAQVDRILNRYLDYGGNYIETAAAYGKGLSEQKIGRAVAHRRHEFILASKIIARDAAGARQSIEKSLSNLRTDYLDILFFHSVQKPQDWQQILSPNGALEEVHRAQKAGRVRLIGITGHGHPALLLNAVQQFPFDVLMTGMNYFDHCNFPQIENELIPLCRKQQTGLIAMKALADGYLYRSTRHAIRYTLSLPVASLVLGINTLAYLELDWALGQEFQPMTADEREKWFFDAPELGTTVCRQCGKCDRPDWRPSEFFALEGLYDRQMNDGTIPEPPDFSLRERLAQWFAQTDQAHEHYSNLEQQIDPAADYRDLNDHCPYGIDIDSKLKRVHAKLANDGTVY